MAEANEGSTAMTDAGAWTDNDDDLLGFLGAALPGFLDTWVTVVRRDTGRPVGVYTANEDRAGGAGTLPDDPLVYQLHHVDVVPVLDDDDAAAAAGRDMERPVRVLGWAHYKGPDDDKHAAAAAALLPPYEYLDLQGGRLCPEWADWDRDAWFVDEDTEALELGGGCEL